MSLHQVITINGSTGEVILGEISTVEPELSDYFNIIMGWANKVKRLSIRTNAETPEDVKIAKKDLVPKELVFVEQNICFLTVKE